MSPFAGSPVVLQVLPSLVTGGVERGTVEIAQAIAEAEATALVASAGGPLVRQIERAGGIHVTLPLNTKSPLGIWRNAAALEALIRDHKVSLVHARSRAPAWSAWLACQRTGVPFVTTYHGTYGEGLPFKRLYNSVMGRGRIVIAASRFIADLVTARHRVDPARVRVIPRGVDPAVFDPAGVAASRIAKLAASWRLPEGMRPVVLPGRLTSWKGHAVLLDAIARLNRHGRRCACLSVPIRDATSMPGTWSVRRRGWGSPTDCGSSDSATTCRPRWLCRMSWCMHRRGPRPSAGS